MNQPMTPPTAPQPRGCLPTLLIGVVMFGILIAGFVASGALANEPPKPIRLTNDVAFTAPWEWEYQGSSPDSTLVVLSRGNGGMAVQVTDETDPVAALQKLRDEWEASGVSATSDIAPVTDLRPGDNVQRFAYTGEFEDIAGAVEGQVTAIAGDGYVVLFDAWSGLGEFMTVRDQVATMIRDARIP